MSDKDICGAEKDDGGICESPFVGENGLCAAHGPDGGETMRERGRRGAEVTNRQRQSDFDADDLPQIKTFDDIREWAQRIGRAAAAGDLNTKRANSLARLLREARSALESKTEGKIEELREELEKVRKEVEEPWRA